MPRAHPRGQQLSLKDFHGGSIQTGSVALPSAPKSDRTYAAGSDGSGEYSNRNQYASSSLAHNSAYNDRYKAGYASRGSYEERPPHVSQAEYSHGFGNSAYSGGGADFAGRGGYGGSGPRNFDGGDSGAARWSPDREYGPGGGRTYRPPVGRDNGTPDSFDIPSAAYRPPKSAGQQARMEGSSSGFQTTTEVNGYGNLSTPVQSRLLIGGGMKPFGDKPVIHSRLVDPDPRTMAPNAHAPPPPQQNGMADSHYGYSSAGLRAGGVAPPGGAAPRSGYQPAGQHNMSGQGHGGDYGDVNGSSLLLNGGPGVHASGYGEGRSMRNQAAGNGGFQGQSTAPQQPYTTLASSVPVVRQQEANGRNGPAPYFAADSRPVSQQAASRVPEKSQPEYPPPPSQQQHQQMRPSYQDYAPAGPYANGMGGRPQQPTPQQQPYSQLIGPPASANLPAQNYQQAPYKQLANGPGIQQQPYQQPYSQLVNGPLVSPGPSSARNSPPHAHSGGNGPRSVSPAPTAVSPAAPVQRPRLNLLPRSQPPPELPRPDGPTVVAQVAGEKAKAAGSDGERPVSASVAQPAPSVSSSTSRPSSARSSSSEGAAKATSPTQPNAPVAAGTTEQAAPQRPKLNLLPRSLPLENPPPTPAPPAPVAPNRPTSASSSGSGAGGSAHGRPSGGSSDDAKWQRVSHSRNSSAGGGHQPLAPGFAPYFHSALVDPPALMLTAIGTETFGGGPVGRSDNCSWQSNNMHGRMGGVAVGGSAGQLWGNSGTW
eukprot:jgi/Mesvir1/6019/Mv00764-RA.1